MLKKKKRKSRNICVLMCICMYMCPQVHMWGLTCSRQVTAFHFILWVWVSQWHWNLQIHLVSGQQTPGDLVSIISKTWNYSFVFPFPLFFQFSFHAVVVSVLRLTNTLHIQHLTSAKDLNAGPHVDTLSIILTKLSLPTKKRTAFVGWFGERTSEGRST